MTTEDQLDSVDDDCLLCGGEGYVEDEPDAGLWGGPCPECNAEPGRDEQQEKHVDREHSGSM